MRWIGRLSGLIAALAGLAAAQGLGGQGQAMVLPTTATVSVTVPTLPAPLPTPTVTATVPLPAPPPPTVAPAPVPPAAPPPAVVSQVTSVATTPRVAATTPTSTPSASTTPSAPTGAAAGAPSSSAAPTGAAAGTSSPSAGANGSAGTPTWSRGEPRGRRPPARTRQDPVEAKIHRSKNRVSVRLEFKLPKAKRMFLIVRGPSPSCRIVGIIPFRGRKGENVASFAGRAGERRLEPGVYLLTIAPQRRPTPGAQTEYARVVSPRRTVPLPEGARRPTCTLAQTLAANATARFLSTEPPMAAPSVATLRPAVPAAPLRPPLAPAQEQLGPDEDDGGGALGAIREVGSAARDSAGGAIATFAILLVVGLLLIWMAGLVTRFLRGTWNP